MEPTRSTHRTTSSAGKTKRSEEMETIGRVLGRTPSGIFILTAGNAAGDETGMLSSWVQQTSFEPPMVTVAVNNKRYLNAWIDESPRLALSLVGESQKWLLSHFGRGFEPGEPAFQGLDVRRAATGLPLLAEALGFLEGTVVGRIDTGDHTLYVIEVINAGAGDSFSEDAPMVHIRKTAFHY